MRIAVVGGKLQGLEIIYLAKTAGFETVLIDKNSILPAGGLCDNFVEFDFNQHGTYPNINSKIDLIIPALEDEKTLELIYSWGQDLRVPVALDLEAFKISSSKNRSNTLIKKLRLERAKNWPECDFPVIVKPDNASGSAGVVKVDSLAHLEEIISDYQKNPIVEEYLSGPSYSIEVIGKPGNYVTLPITELFMDRDYDCCGVLAPANLPIELQKELQTQICTMAQELQLHGIMDLEVIMHEGVLKILEIDARFPSQTPIAIFHATGVNMVELLADLFLTGRVDDPNVAGGYSFLEHVKVEGAKIDFEGEHIMAKTEKLQLITPFYGAKTAITDFYSSLSAAKVATLVHEGCSHEEVDLHRQNCMSQLTELTRCAA